MDRGSYWLSGLLVCRISFVFGMADGGRCGMRNRQFGDLGVFSDLGRAASGGKVGGLAKRVCKLGRRRWTSADWAYCGLDRRLSGGACDYGGSLPAFRGLVGVFCWGGRAKRVGPGVRERACGGGCRN